MKKLQLLKDIELLVFLTYLHSLYHRKFTHCFIIYYGSHLNIVSITSLYFDAYYLSVFVCICSDICFDIIVCFRQLFTSFCLLNFDTVLYSSKDIITTKKNSAKWIRLCHLNFGWQDCTFAIRVLTITIEYLVLQVRSIDKMVFKVVLYIL